MSPSLSPEFVLTAACVMWPPSRCRTEAIDAAARAPMDWDRFLRVVKRHQVLALVSDGLTRMPDKIAPAKIAAEITSQAATQVRRSLAMAAEAARLQRLFDDADVPVLFLKGASLAVLAYGDLALRESKDIDLLVPPDTLKPARAIIERAGYRRIEPPADIGDTQLQQLVPLRRDFGYVHELTGEQLELHWRLCLNPHIMNETTVTSSSRIVPLTSTIGLRTLGEEDLFTYLCVHGALHWWYRLRWLADIAALLSVSSEGSAERLYAEANTRGAGRAVAQALLLCRDVLHTPLPSHLILELGKTPRVRWLQRTALDAMTSGRDERRPLDVRFGTLRGSLSALLLGQSWRYRFTELRNLLTNQTDMLLLPLPKRFRFLYPVLRLPLWIWRHTLGRASSQILS